MHSAGDDEPGATEWAVPGQVGVGPWPGGAPDWPDDARYDPELLAHGDARNVVDAYRYWRRDAVAADLAARAHPFHVAIENFGHDHNIGTVGARPTRSARPVCTSWGVAGGTGAEPW